MFAKNRFAKNRSRLARIFALAAVCAASPWAFTGDARAGQFEVVYFPVGSTHETIGVYDPYGAPFGGSLGEKSWSWSLPVVLTTHIDNNPVSGTSLSFFGSTTTPNTTDAGEWAWQQYDEWGSLAPAYLANSTNLLYLYSGGTLGVHVYYYLSPGQTFVPDKGGVVPAVTVQNSCEIIGQGDASSGPADNGKLQIVDSDLLNPSDGVLTLNGRTWNYGMPTRGLVSGQELINRQTTPKPFVQTSASGQQYIDCGTYTVSASIRLNAHQCYPAGTYVSAPPIDPYVPSPYADTFLQFRPYAQANQPDSVGLLPVPVKRGHPRRPPAGSLPTAATWYDATAGRWRFSDKAARTLRAMGVNPDTDPRYRPVYGGTITHKDGISFAHSAADNALIDEATGGGAIADQKMLQQMRMQQIIDAATNPAPDYVNNLPQTWDTDTGTYSDSGAGGYPGAGGSPGK